MKSIYILLTRTNTVVSKCIHVATGNDFTHVSLSLDKKFTCLYSFGRKHKRTALPAGFVKESLNEGIMGDSNDINCAVYELKISNSSYKRLLRILDDMEMQMDIYRYNILGLPMCLLRVKKERKRHYFCSQFVSYVLIQSGAVHIEKAPSLVKPADFQSLPGAIQIFRGSIGQLRNCI